MNPNCPRCGAGGSIKHGSYWRYEDAQRIARYRCKACGRCHSSATQAPTYRQKRRRLNRLIEADIASSTAERRIALKLGCARKTVARKVRFLAAEARRQQHLELGARRRFKAVQFDELISFEHTRFKPLSVAVMVARPERFILGVGVAPIPASGLIADKARERYGLRHDGSAAMRQRLLSHCAPFLDSDALRIDTDEHPDYASEIARALPQATHRQYRSIRGALSGQGELKRTAHDPLFTINHTLAMLRDNIKRLARRSWCTTKRRERLADILAIYVHYHNSRLIPPVSRSA